MIRRPATPRESMSNSTSGEARRAFLRAPLRVAGAAILALSNRRPGGPGQHRRNRWHPRKHEPTRFGHRLQPKDVYRRLGELIRHVNNAFVNGGFRKGLPSPTAAAAAARRASGRGGFANGGGGGFRNGGFVNGGFRNY